MAVLDSGNRREFESGAVRDMAEGKGRCDLLPLDVIEEILDHHVTETKFVDASITDIFMYLSDFQKTGIVRNIIHAIHAFDEIYGTNKNGSIFDLILETSHQFEDGAVKYGDNNWRKGMPTSVFLDSAIRHLLKFLRGDTDERHDRAFVWNCMCLVWMHKNRPDMRNIPFKECEDLKNDKNC